MFQMNEEDLERAFRRWRDESQKTRYITPSKKQADKAFSRRIESQVRSRLQERGYVVSRTGHNDSFDLWCNGARIEIKAAALSKQGYRANMRANDADVLILGCQNGQLHFFVIPFDLVRGKCYVKITSSDPAEYMGRFMPYYEAWGVVDEAVDRAPERYQLPLL